MMSSTIGLRLFSELDDGAGHAAVELLLDAWLEDGVENSSEILQVCTTHTLIFQLPNPKSVNFLAKQLSLFAVIKTNIKM